MPLPVLGLFAKRPLAGQVKTRLAAATSPAWAAQVADAFLHDTLARLEGVAADRVLAFAPDDENAYFASVVGERYRLTLQGDGDLGRRMERFFSEQLATGAERVVLVGADSPTLPLDFITQAFRELERADVVLGPATDGGYYLIGLARRLPPIFDGISWSGPQVLAETVARLATHRSHLAPRDVLSHAEREDYGSTSPEWRLALLPPWYDVDTLDDWRMLQGHLAALQRAGIDPELPRTLALPDPP